MIFRSVFACLMTASIAAGAVEYDVPQGTIQRPGYDYMTPDYVNSVNDADDFRVVATRNRFSSSYVSLNDQIPSQVVVVAPQTGASGVASVNDANIELASGEFLRSSGIIPGNSEFELVSKRFVMNKTWFLKFRRVVRGIGAADGIPCEDGGLGLAMSPWGKVDLLWGNIETGLIKPVRFSINQEVASGKAIDGIEGTVRSSQVQGQVIFPLYFGGDPEYHSAYKFMIVTIDPYAEWEVFVDAESGEVLQRQDKVYHDVISGNASGSIQHMYPFDPWEDRDFFHLDLDFDGYDPVTTDMSGDYSIEVGGSDPLNVYVYLRGPYLQVMNDNGGEAEISDVVDPPSNYDVYWDDSNSTAPERDAWYSGVTVHNWIKTLDPDLTVMDFPMICNVNVEGSCNAFWSGWDRTINFYRAGGGCSNIAQIADVVYHEYGHGITDLQTRPYGPNGAMHEGFSDYTACTITNQPLVGVGFYIQNPYTPLRTLDNDRRYPDDVSGEPHNDGLIIGGALWHTRAELSPHPMGYTDSLWHFARYAQTQDFESYFWAFVAEDDDDGDLSNGTPNDLVIFHNFGDRHGIGPGTAMTIVADTIMDSEDTTRSFPLAATISSVFELRSDSVLIYYDNGTGYAAIPMVFADAAWRGTIPPQRNDTHVNYYILAVDRGSFRGTWPDGAPQNHYTFYVGPDQIPPTLSLVEGPPNTVNLLGPYGPFIIDAFDANGVDPYQVRLHYFVNGESESSAPLGPGPDEGEFMLESLDLDRQLESGDTVHYYFTARDGAHNPNTGRLPQSGSYALVMTTVEIFEDFERYGLDHWTVDEGWTLRNDGRYSSHSVWFASPNYPNNANASMTANLDYDLSPYSSVLLTFFRKQAIRIGDTCFVEASNNGGSTWSRIGAFTDTIYPQIFRYTECDLGPVLSPDAHHYKMRFRFVSDDTLTWAGIFIDDVGWRVEPMVGVGESGGQVSDAFELLPNYPNPFNPSTSIRFSLPAASDVRLEIFDILGRRVGVLVDERLNAGEYNVAWNGTDADGDAAASGIYFYRLTTGQGTRQAKMTLLR